VPAISDILSGRVEVASLRQVEIQDAGTASDPRPCCRIQYVSLLASCWGTTPQVDSSDFGNPTSPSARARIEVRAARIKAPRPTR
jgi:hypothetical protein